MKRNLLAFACCLCMGIVVWTGILMRSQAAVLEEEKIQKAVAISEGNFPDEIFRNYVRQEFDRDNDGILSEVEKNSVTKIVIKGDKRGVSYNAGDYKGIEVFTELEDIEIEAMVPASSEYSCDCDVDISLNVSKNRKLKRFFCKAGVIKKLNLSGLPLLEEICLIAGGYPEQDLSASTRLKKVGVQEWEDLVKFPEQMPFLESMSFWTLGNGMAPKIDFQASPNLSVLNLSGFNYTDKQLDLNQLTKLESFGFHPSGTSVAVNLEGCRALKRADIMNIYHINLNGCTELKDLSLYGNWMEKLDVTGLANLEYLWVVNLYDKSLDLRKNQKLKKVEIRKTKLKKILFLSKARYRKLSVEDNKQLTKLDLRKIKVNKVYCKYNNIHTLKIKGNRVIRELYCQNNRLKKLDVRGCKQLKVLRYGGNKKLKKNNVRRK